MILAEYLHELLLQHEIVIIPGFGAFVSNYKPAEINEETKEIIPPSKEISFNQQIRNNDGLLVDYVAKNQTVSHFDALKIIEKERENIIYQLDKGEQITLEHIGILFRNEQNEIVFEAQIEENLLLDSFGLEPVSLAENESEPEVENVTEQDEPEIAEVIEPVVATETDEPTEEDGSIESEIKIDSEEVKTEEPDVSDTEEEDTAEKKTEEILNIEPEESTTDEPEPIVVKNDVPDAEPEERKKKRGWLWFLLLLIPVILIGLFFTKKHFFTGNSHEIVPREETLQNGTRSQESASILDSVATDTVNIPSDSVQVESIKNNIPVAADSAISKFYLVGGSFKEQENVDKFMEQFDAEGYDPFLLGKRGSFFIVAIGTYSTEREAVLARDTFTERNPDSETWVFEDKSE